MIRTKPPTDTYRDGWDRVFSDAAPVTIKTTTTRVVIGSAFAELLPGGNVAIGLTHSEEQRGAGLLHGTFGNIVIEKADVSDMIWALRLLTGDTRP